MIQGSESLFERFDITLTSFITDGKKAETPPDSGESIHETLHREKIGIH
jgi:hypothetical protein